MAFASGNVSSEGTGIKRYIGVGSVYVLGVNPNKANLESFYGHTMEKEPEYVGETEVNGNTVKQVRIDFIVKADPEKYLDNSNNPVDLTTKVSLFLTNSYRYNKDNTKIQVIDKYGRTAWVTIEQAKNHEIPVYENGPANIDAGYRPAYMGEEELVSFLIAYINIPSCQKYVDKKWVMKPADELKDCEASLEHIKDYFNGDVSELRNILSYQPKNKLKVLFGVKTRDDNRQFQTIYTRMFLKNSVNDYSRLDKNVQEAKNSGAFSTTEYDCSELHEYTVESTSFAPKGSENDMPFAPEGPTPW